MNWQQKAEALNALSEISLKIRHAGDWYVNQSVEVGGDDSAVVVGTYGNGTTPEVAIEDHWKRLCDELPSNQYLVIGRANERRHVRWNGFMWIDLPMKKGAQS